MTANTPLVEWPRADYSRVPFWLYHDLEIYRLEQEKIFRGPCWSFVCLEAELPNPGDFRTSFIGDTPILATRGMDGAINVVVNRCAHRGAVVRREAYGNAPEHICIYHRWCYAPDGSLMGLPFRRGLRGKGGMGADFQPEQHGLQKLRVGIHAGVIFASFSDAAEPLEEYLGPVFLKHLDRLFSRPVRILGYQRQRLTANWKLYPENVRDTYHGSLLHDFQSKFGLSRTTQQGGVTMDKRHRHNLTHAIAGTDDEDEFSRLYSENKVHDLSLTLREPEIVQYRREFDDHITLAICGIFPNATFQQIGNSLAARQLRTNGPDEFEIVFTLFGYQDDSEDMIQHRLLQANNVGPAGLVSMEDGEAIEITHRATGGDRGRCSVIEMGGGGPIVDLQHRVNDMSCRGFWSYWAELMGVEPEGAER